MYVACPLQNLVRRLGFGAELSPRDAGMLSYPLLVTSPLVCGDKTPTRNDSIAWLGPMVGSWVQVPARVDLRRTDYIQWGQAWLLKCYKAGLPLNCCGSCRPEPTGGQHSQRTAMKIYAYPIRPGAGFRIRRLHWKILYNMPRGTHKKIISYSSVDLDLQT
jgi:hypothetical protein